MSFDQKKYNAQWKKDNKDHVSTYNAKWRIENKDAVKKHKHSDYVKHKNRIMDSRKKFLEKNPLATKKYNKKYRITHREKINQKIRERRKKYPDKYKEKKHKRRARIIGARGGWSLIDIAILRKILGEECPAPGEHRGLMSIDHIIPLACGGSNEPTNLQFLCQRHNGIKSHRSRNDYRTPLQIKKILAAFQMELFNAQTT